jgi:hypothetical protein
MAATERISTLRRVTSSCERTCGSYRPVALADAFESFTAPVLERFSPGPPNTVLDERLTFVKAYAWQARKLEPIALFTGLRS